jgi:hypothetical protein
MKADTTAKVGAVVQRHDLKDEGRRERLERGGVVES